MESNNEISMNYQKAIDNFNAIQLEILEIGWTGILNTYHPDVNTNHKEAFKVFQLYKEIYNDMKKRMIIKGE